MKRRAVPAARTVPIGEIEMTQTAVQVSFREIREILLEKRKEMTPQAQSARERVEPVRGDQGEIADAELNNFLKRKIGSNPAKVVAAIDDALARLDAGKYGICRDCGEPIAENRLRAIPWTKTCITCKESRPNKSR